MKSTLIIPRKQYMENIWTPMQQQVMRLIMGEGERQHRELRGLRQVNMWYSMRPCVVKAP